MLLIAALLVLVGCGHRTLPLATSLPGVTPKERQLSGREYMVTTQGGASTAAGENIFRMGGNAVDAAVAVSFAISVERPQSTGLGGGGFMLVHLAKQGKTVAVDFRETAPAKARADMFLDKKGNVIPRLSLDGPLSAGVPGLVAGLHAVHRKYGKLKWEVLLRPAIKLARQGFPVYPHLARAIRRREAVLKTYPASQKIFFHPDGKPLGVGETLVQKDLAKTLELVARLGRKGFYTGLVAQKIVETGKKYGGIIGHKDLQSYQVRWRRPVWGNFAGYKIASMPPPSSGGIHVIQILNILAGYDLKKDGPMAVDSIHRTASAMQRAFADRAVHLGDTDFVKVPVSGLVSPDYAASLRKSIPAKRTLSPEKIRAGIPWPFENPKESSETTHFTVMDARGDTVSSTQTINNLFGSGVTVAGTGIVLNDEMDDFSAKPGASNLFGAVGGRKNAIAPGKRPLSSMSPTIVFDQTGQTRLALGSPSGTRIISCVAQTILNHLLYGLPLSHAVAGLRYHHQWMPDKIWVDEPGFPSRLTKKLERRGYKIRTRNLGCKVNAISREDSGLLGVTDPRGEGASGGR